MLNRFDHSSEQVHGVADIWMLAIFDPVNAWVENRMNLVSNGHTGVLPYDVPPPGGHGLLPALQGSETHLHVVQCVASHANEAAPIVPISRAPDRRMWPGLASLTVGRQQSWVRAKRIDEGSGPKCRLLS